MTAVTTGVPPAAAPEPDSPAARAGVIANKAARAAARLSAGAALVPGPLGLVSLLPEIVGIWKVQARMVVDIAAVYGKNASPSRAEMLYCLFRHLLSQGVRDVAVRAGGRVLVRGVSLTVALKLAASIGVKLSERAAGRLIARYAAVIGAAGVGIHAFYDTQRVARTAIELFSGELVIDVDAIWIDE